MIELHGETEEQGFDTSAPDFVEKASAWLNEHGGIVSAEEIMRARSTGLIRLVRWKRLPVSTFTHRILRPTVVWTHGDPKEAAQCGRPVTAVATLDPARPHVFTCELHGELSATSGADRLWQTLVKVPL